MINFANVGLGHTTGSIDNLSEQQSKSSVKENTGQIQHLTPAGGLQGSRSRAIAMQAQINNAAHQPSTSKNQRYNSLLVLKARDYQNAPGSSISLTTGGLAGGGPREATAWYNSLSQDDKTLFNRYRSDTSKVRAEDYSHALSLSREYHRLYKASGKKYSGESSGQGDTGSTRPTTGQLRLTESDMKKYYGSN